MTSGEKSDGVHVHIWEVGGVIDSGRFKRKPTQTNGFVFASRSAQLWLVHCSRRTRRHPHSSTDILRANLQTLAHTHTEQMVTWLFCCSPFFFYKPTITFSYTLKTRLKNAGLLASRCVCRYVWLCCRPFI